MGARIPYVKVYGYGSGAYSYAFVSRVPSTLPASGWSPGTTIPALVAAPDVYAVKLDILDGVGGASDMSVDLLFEGTAGSSEVGGIIASDGLPLSDGSGGYVKTSRYEDRSTTTIAVHDSGSIAADDYVWIAGEVMLVTGTTSTTLTVTRAARDTWARPIPYSRVTSGTPVYADPPTVVGLGAEVGYVDESGDETVVWRGFVTGATLRSGSIVTMSMRSIVGYLQDVDISAPVAVRSARLPDLRLTSGELLDADPSGPFAVDADLYGDPSVHSSTEWSYARVYDEDDQWVIVPVSHVETVTDAAGRRLARYSMDLTSVTDITAGGTGSTALFFDGVDGDRLAFAQRVLRSGHRIEYVQRVTGTLGTIYQTLLTSADIAGADAGLPSGWFVNVLASSASGVLPANDWRDGNHYVPSFKGSALKQIQTLYSDPLFVGLAEDAGVLRLVDWAPRLSVGTSDTIGDADFAESSYTFQLRGTQAYPVVRLDEDRITRGSRDVPSGLVNTFGDEIYYAEDTEVSNSALIISQLGVQSNAWTQQKAIKVIGYAGAGWGILLRRASAVVDLYDRALPTLEISCQPTSTVSGLRVGALVRVSQSTLPTAAGVRGATSGGLLGLLTERSVRVHTGETSLRIVILDWYESQLAGAVWGPAALVQSWSAATTQATVGANDYSTSSADGDLPATDGEAFAVVLSALGTSVSVDLLDETGAYRDTGTLAAATGAGKLVITGLSVTPQTNDIVILSDSSTVASSVLSTTVTSGPVGFLSDSSGDVRGGATAGRVYL